MNLEQLQQQLTEEHKAPVDQWNPAYCGDVDIEIQPDGRWFYQGTPIGRQALVKLFASVIKQEGNEYFLVTPVEKMRIRVRDLPFVVVNWEWSAAEHILQVETNIGEKYPLSKAYPLVMIDELPAVKIRAGLHARVHRNVYYKWAELVEPATAREAPGYYLQSGTARFWFGPAD